MGHDQPANARRFVARYQNLAKRTIAARVGAVLTDRPPQNDGKHMTRGTLRRLRFGAVLGLLAALILTGCGGTDDDTSGPKTDAKPVSSTVTTADLRSALLTTDDLPTGYAVGATPTGADTAGMPDDAACAAALKGFKSSATVGKDATKADVQFSAGDAGPFLLESVAWIEGGAAATGFTTFRSALAKCDTWTMAQPDGTKSTVTLAPATFPKLGDDSYAYRLTIRLGTLSVGSNMVVLRVGNALCVLVHSGVPSVPVADTVAVGRTAATKLATLTR